MSEWRKKVHIMDRSKRSELLKIGRNKIEFDFKIEQYTFFRVGGKVEIICFVDEISFLVQLVSYLRKEKIPFLVVGNGSNILVKDKGLKGAVIILKGRLAEIEASTGEKDSLVTGGGLSVMELIHYCAREGLSGLEFMAGIPGTVGGAAVMNAGAYGHEICECIEDVRIVTGQGKKVVLDRSEIDFTYRVSSIPSDSVVYGVTLKLKIDSRDRINKRIMGYLEKRKETQPVDLPSCGSVFRNPSGDYAGRLIEKAGLKGEKIGGAMISPKHANYIVNTGGARASDILALMELAKRRVNEKFGIKLVSEVRVVGE
jgi:UDP-N-acetylmuramate dehydrogenase